MPEWDRRAAWHGEERGMLDRRTARRRTTADIEQAFYPGLKGRRGARESDGDDDAWSDSEGEVSAITLHQCTKGLLLQLLESLLSSESD